MFLCLQASFVATGNRTDISLEDPDFWQKWAKKAELDLDAINGRVLHTSTYTHGHTHRHTDERLHIYWSAATLKPLTGAGKPWILVFRYPGVTLICNTHLNTAAGNCTPQKLLRNGLRSHSDRASIGCSGTSMEAPPHNLQDPAQHRTPLEVVLPWLEGPELPWQHERGIYNIRQPFFNFCGWSVYILKTPTL